MDVPHQWTVVGQLQLVRFKIVLLGLTTSSGACLLLAAFLSLLLTRTSPKSALQQAISWVEEVRP